MLFYHLPVSGSQSLPLRPRLLQSELLRPPSPDPPPPVQHQGIPHPGKKHSLSRLPRSSVGSSIPCREESRKHCSEMLNHITNSFWCEVEASLVGIPPKWLRFSSYLTVVRNTLQMKLISAFCIRAQHPQVPIYTRKANILSWGHWTGSSGLYLEILSIMNGIDDGQLTY